jgi:hypothetical protein
MLIRHLVFVARDAPNSVLGEELLKIPILTPLSLTVYCHEITIVGHLGKLQPEPRDRLTANRLTNQSGDYH